MRLLLSLVINFQCLICFCQIEKNLEFNTIDKAIAEGGHFWKIDSLGSNGFRDCYADKLLAKKIVPVKYQVIIDNFGKPSEERYNNKIISLSYNIFDPRHMPWLSHPPLMYWYIVFTIDKNTMTLLRVDRWHVDL
jgi:hypothetical protein